MNSYNQTDLQDWELLPQEAVVSTNKSLEHAKVEIKPSQASKVEIKPSQASKEVEPCEMTRVDSIKVDDSDHRDGGGNDLNMWKWSLNGIGTVCSFGVAAVSVCIIILGNQRKNKLQFHVYTNDKRIKNQQSRLDEAISTLGGAIVTRARLTVGGVYDTSL